jgi:hypothetical protein
MQYQKFVEGIGDHRICHILFSGEREDHLQETTAIVEFIVRVIYRVTNGVFISPGSESRHLGKRTHDAEINTLCRAVRIEGLWIECRLCTE